MALPPEGNPRRLLRLAARSSRLLGIILILLGTLGALPIFLMRRLATPTGFVALQIAMILLFYVGPGAAYIISAIYIRQRKVWAVIMSLVLTSIYLLLCLFGLIGLIVMAATDPSSGAGVWVAVGAAMLLAAAFTQHIFHLAKCFKAIQLTSDDEARGFEPLMVQPNQPAEEGGSADAQYRA